MRQVIRQGSRRLRIAYCRSCFLQIGVLIAAWAAGEWITALLRLPVPGGVIGFGVLLLFLHRGWVSPRWFRRGAAGLLDHLMLFFVPAMVAVIAHRELLGWVGLKLLGAVMIGTLIVMTGTALIVDLGFRWKERHGH